MTKDRELRLSSYNQQLREIVEQVAGRKIYKLWIQKAYWEVLREIKKTRNPISYYTLIAASIIPHKDHFRLYVVAYDLEWGIGMSGESIFKGVKYIKFDRYEDAWNWLRTWFQLMGRASSTQSSHDWIFVTLKSFRSQLTVWSGVPVKGDERDLEL